MAQPIYMYITIKGKVVKGTSKLQDDSVEVLKLLYSVDRALEALSGKPTDERVHQPVVITKRIDEITPNLLQALVGHEKVDSVRFDFYHPDPNGGGGNVCFYKITLNNANVATVKQHSADANVVADVGTPPLEDISFVFDEILWENDANAKSSDKWTGQP